jgi:hypothetical protein
MASHLATSKCPPLLGILEQTHFYTPQDVILNKLCRAKSLGCALVFFTPELGLPAGFLGLRPNNGPAAQQLPFGPTCPRFN